MTHPGIIVDNFAGGGGASTGIELALGRSPDIAINHDAEALAMHSANHPETLHLRQSVWKADPQDVAAGRPVDLAWFSPDCVHFSKAKGGKPRKKHIRDLAWVVVHWIERVKPRVILMENVEEFRTWGPLDAEGYAIKERAGETFDFWCRQIRKHGYKLEFRELRACDYGAPTIRKRLFMIARCDGRPIVWPAPSHGALDDPDVIAGRKEPWRKAADIIDWSIPCPSIFERKKPLVEKTLARIARGIQRYVIGAEEPFVIPLTHGGGENRAYASSDPLKTITTAQRGEFALVNPYLVSVAHGDSGSRRSYGLDEPHGTVTAGGISNGIVAPVLSRMFGQSTGQGCDAPAPTVTAGGGGKSALLSASLIQTGYGERPGQMPRALNLEKPLGTVVAGGGKHALVSAFLAKHFGGMTGVAARQPFPTVTTRGTQNQVVTSHLMKLRGTCKDGQPVTDPAPTITAGGLHLGEVRAFLTKYYSGGGTSQSLKDPAHTLTAKARLGLVTIRGQDYQIVDIGMRMLTPRELFRAQGFPDETVIAPVFNGKPLTKTAQIRMCGNSVCPPLARAIVAANCSHLVAKPARAAGS